MYVNNPTKCRLESPESRQYQYVNRYIAFFLKNDVKFDYSKEDKKLFEKLQEAYGSERDFEKEAQNDVLCNNSCNEAQNEVIFKPNPFTVWNFSKCAKDFGVPDFPGRIPGQVIQNVLYYYTGEDDLVVDPMAGSGTTYDVCVVMNRKPLCYDLAPIREEIRKHDISEGYPDEAQDCNLIFLDPPYFKKLQKKERYAHLENAEVQQFLSFMRKLARDSFSTIRKLGVVALIISDYIDYDRTLLTSEYYSLFKEAGFKAISRFQVPLSTQQYRGHQRERAIENKELLNISRDLYVFRKF